MEPSSLMRLSVNFFLVTFVLICPKVFAFEEMGVVDSTCNAVHRSVHIIPNKIPITDLPGLFENVKKAGFCTIVIGIRSGLLLDSIHIESHVPILDRKYFQALKKMGDSFGIEVVPEIKLLTHQEQLFKTKFPNEMINLTTYNPRSEKLWFVVKSVLLELIELLDPVAIHIGHDEVAGSTSYSKKRFMRPGERTLLADEYLFSVTRLYDFLHQRGIQTWMWGDMLISHDDAQEMTNKNFHGEMHGYGKTLRAMIPTGVLIFDWHYHDTRGPFSSIEVFKNAGFNVVGVSYKSKVNIARFTDAAKKQGALGMMVTNWDFPLKPDFDVLYKRIEFAGAIFSQKF